MKARVAARLVAPIVAAACTASATSRALPIYIEDNHAGTFYWLAQHVDLDQPCTLIHFDAHSDASGIFDSDNIRADLRNVASTQEREKLLDRMRGTGAVQCFNWIEPLMPAPIAKVIWVPGEKLTSSEIQKRAKQATSLLDGHLEAAPRKSGSFSRPLSSCPISKISRRISTTRIRSSSQSISITLRKWRAVKKRPPLRAFGTL